MESTISKSLLRKVALDYRRLLDDKDFHKRNQRLCEKIIKLVKEGNFKTIHVFLPMKRNKEPDVTIIFEQLRSLGTKIVTSKTNFKEKTLSHFYVEQETKLVLNKMGIPEPTDAREADFSMVDLVLCPLASADKEGNRIGYGGGFYDQLLKNCSEQKVGLTLAPLLDEIVQKETWDIPLNTILTPFD